MKIKEITHSLKSKRFYTQEVANNLEINFNKIEMNKLILSL